MKYKTVGVVLGVLAMMVVGTAFAASNTSDIEVLNQELRNATREGNTTYAAELMNRLMELKGYTEEAITSPKAPEGILERAPFMSPFEEQASSPFGYEFKAPQTFGGGTISLDHTCASTWLGPEGTCDSCETSQKMWYRYIMYDGETIEWVIDCADDADYDIQIWEYLPCCQKGDPITGAFSQFHPDTLTYTDPVDGEQQWLWVEIHKYGTGNDYFTLRGIRHSKDWQPQYLTSYALNDWGYPTNGVEGTFTAHNGKADTHFYSWVVPSYFDSFHLQVTKVCSTSCAPLDSFIRVEIWNDCEAELLDSIICDDHVYPDTSVSGIQGYEDEVLIIKVIDTFTARDYDVEYRLDYNYFFDKVECICAKPEVYDLEIDKGQCRDYIFVIENCSNHPSLTLTYVLKADADANGIIDYFGHGGATLAPGEVDTDTVHICAPMPVDPTQAYDYTANIWVDVTNYPKLDKYIPIYLHVPAENEGKPNKVLLSADHFYEVLGLQDSAWADGEWQQYIEFENTGTAKLHYEFDPDTAWDDVKGCDGVDIGDFTWLRLSSDSGAIAPGASKKVYLQFRSDMMFPGLHIATLHLFTNDPDDQEETFVCTLKVKAPNKLLTPDPGDTIKTEILCCHKDTQYITIGNNGNVNLVIDKIRWDPFVEWLSIADKEGFILEPGDIKEIPLIIDSHGPSLVWCEYSQTAVLIEDNDPYCVVDPETVYVEVKLKGPKIWIHPQQFHATLKAGPAQDGEDEKQKLQILNPGCEEDLEWTITEMIGSDWLKAIPSSGVTTVEEKTGTWDSVDIFFDTQTWCVPPGNFTDTLLLTSNACDDPEIKIPVVLRAEGAWVSTVPESLDVTIPKCKIHKEILQICNIGADTLVCGLKATATISLHIDSITVSGDWGTGGVSISPADEHYIEPQKCHDFEVTFDTHKAGVGEFTGTIRIWIHEGNANHQEPYFDVPVSFIVTGSGMTVTGGPINDSLVVYKGMNCENAPDISVAEHELIITNGGDEDLEWSLHESNSTCDPEFVSWIQASPMGGVVAPLGAVTVTVELNACQLEPCSTYTHYICIQGNDQNNPEEKVEVKLTVGEPEIYLSETEIAFGPMQPCEDTCETKTFVIQNDGPHIDLEYTITETPEAPWLTVSKTSGVLDQYDEDIITLIACAGELAADTYETDLVISSNDPDGDVSVHVTMIVHAAWVEVSPASFDIHVSYEKCKDTMLIITNTGDKPSSWGAQLDALADWFSFEPASGTVPAADADGPGLDTIFMTFCHVEGMEPGDFAERTFVFDAYEDNCAPKDLIPVKITIDAPDIAVTPPCYYITLGLEESLDTTFTICNEGAAELNIHSITHSSCSWLTVADSVYAIDPGDCVTHDVHFYTPIGLDCCTTYVDTIEITSNDPDENPTTICVALDVECPVIRVTETSIAETLAADEVACPASFYIVNDGCLDLEWLLAENPYESWVSFSPVTGTTVPGDSTLVTVCFDGPELFATGETDDATTIVVTSNDPKYMTKTISVSFHITSTKLAVNPGNIEIGVNVGDSMDKLFEITNTSDEIITWNLACRDNVDWLEYPKSGAVNPGETDNIAVHFNATNLTSGTYSTALTLTSGGYSTDIPVKFIVSLKGVEERGLPEIGTCEAVYLSSNTPNPFAAKTSFVYGVPSRTPVTMKVYDCTGKEVKALVDGTVDAGYYKVSWDGTDSYGNKLVSGIYFYRMTADGTSITKKLILLR